ncbi:MAG TPA: glycosyltransferase [bacterium]|nr:glycosyltransferase [bacterium]HPJ71459.1 glycosyltransferase [bacterium]
MPEKPEISVVIAVKDCASYIDECLESALSQGDNRTEVLVVDGGSTDGTWEKVRRYGDRIRGFQDPARGVAAARNLGVAHAGAPYLAFLDGDDYWLPGKLARQTAWMRANPRFRMTFTDTFDLLPSGERIGPCLKTRYSQVPSGHIFESLLEGNFIPSITVMLETALFRAVGGFDENLHFAEDTEMWLRLSRLTEIGFLSEPLAVYRVRPDSRVNRFHEHYRARLKIIAAYLGRTEALPGWNPSRRRRVMARHVRRYADRLFQAGEYPAARREYWKCWREEPLKLHVLLRGLLTWFPPALVEGFKGLKKRR